MPLFYQHNINESEKLGIWKIEEDEAFFLSKVSLQRNISHPHKRLQHLAGRYLLQQLFPDFPYGLMEIADTRKPFLNNEAYHFSISHCGDFAAAIVSRTARVGIDIELVTPTIERIQHKFLSEEEIALWEQLPGADFNRQDTDMLESPGNISNPAGFHLQQPGDASSVFPEFNTQEEAEVDITEQEDDMEKKEAPQLSPHNLEMLTLCWSAKEAVYKWYGDGGVDFRKHIELKKPGVANDNGWVLSQFLFKKEKPVPLMLRSRFFGMIVLTFVVT